MAETEEWAATTAIGVAETEEWAAIAVYSGESAAIAAGETGNASQFAEYCPQSTAFSWDSAVIAGQPAVISRQSTLITADFSAVGVAIVAKGAGIFSDWGATAAIAAAFDCGLIAFDGQLRCCFHHD